MQIMIQQLLSFLIFLVVVDSVVDWHRKLETITSIAGILLNGHHLANTLQYSKIQNRKNFRL
jgi:hypothetical protein